MTRFVAASVALLVGAGSIDAKERRAPVDVVYDLEGRTWLRKPPPELDRPYPAGSLFKLATALAALESGHSGLEELTCTGVSCWLTRGHGRLNLKGALAHSCSAYFVQISERLDATRVLEMARTLGFEPGARLETSASFAGDDASLLIRPTRAALLMAFLATGRRGEDSPPVSEAARLEVRQALVESARFGTSAELLEHLPRAAAKTGTFYDGVETLGWCAGFLPDDSPRFTFAVLVRGATARRGAVPAAARILKAIRWNDSCSRPRR